MAVDRGPFICRSQSMNVHIAEPSTKKLTSMHFYAWKKGLKTGMYYLRTQPKAAAIQFTVNQEQLAAERAKSEALLNKENMLNSSSPPVGKLMLAMGGLETKDENDECLNCSA